MPKKITTTREFINGELVKETIIEEEIETLPPQPPVTPSPYPQVPPWYYPKWYWDITTTTTNTTKET